jgi:hypothetical protein
MFRTLAEVLLHGHDVAATRGRICFVSRFFWLRPVTIDDAVDLVNGPLPGLSGRYKSLPYLATFSTISAFFRIAWVSPSVFKTRGNAFAVWSVNRYHQYWLPGFL